MDWTVAISSKAANSVLTVFGHVAACLDCFICQCSKHVFFAQKEREKNTENLFIFLKLLNPEYYTLGESNRAGKHF